VFVIALLLSVPAVLLTSAPPARAGTPPVALGFSDTLVTGGLNNGRSLAFLPDASGRLILVQAAGEILAWDGATLSTLHTMTEVQDGGERGLLGVAVDPDWPTRPYLYVFYTNLLPQVVQVARFNLTDPGGTLTLDPLSKLILLDDMPDNAGNHNGGTLRFAPDKTLYITVGDDANGCNAQNLTVLAGKVLRIKVDDTIDPSNRSTLAPADNPFILNPDPNAQLVWAWGLRNPFRLDVDPVTGDVFIGDVGQGTWEEVNLANASGLNFGWPFYEGNASYLLPPPPVCGQSTVPPWRAPIYVYDPGGAASVIASTVYRGVNFPNDASFPPEYEGNFFFFDFYANFLRVLRLNPASGWYGLVPGVTATNWGTAYGGVPDMVRGPDGALYLLQNFGANLRRIAFNPSVPPVADFTATPAAVNPGQSVAFDASASSDSDGVITAYDWDFGDGNLGTGILANHAYTNPGSYLVTLTVTDNGSRQDTATRGVWVNAPPTASFTANPSPANPGVNVTFDATSSTDPDGGLLTYDWDLGDGNLTSGAAVVHAYAAAGTYNAILTVTDNMSLVDNLTRAVFIVNTTNQLPVAVLQTNLSVVQVLQVVFFNGSASYDPDGTIIDYAYDFDDASGMNGTTANATHSYAAPGTYTVTLNVTDNGGNSSVASVIFRVNAPPTASFVVTPASGSLATLFQFDATASTDPDGTIVSYAWDFGDTATGVGSSPAHAYTSRALFLVSLTVTDNDGATATANGTVAVVNRPPTLVVNPDVPNIVLSAQTSTTFTATASDPDGDGVLYLWRLDGTVVGNGSTYFFTAGGPGTHVLEVVVSDGSTSTTRTWTVTVASSTTPSTVSWIWLALVLGAIFAAVLAVAFLLIVFARRRRPREGVPPGGFPPPDFPPPPMAVVLPREPQAPPQQPEERPPGPEW